MKSAIVHPGSILGAALSERLRRSTALHLDSLLTTRKEEYETLSEAEGEPALIQQLQGDEADLYFVCGKPDEQRAVAAAVHRGVVVHLEPTGLDNVEYSVAGTHPAATDGDAELLSIHCASPVATALAQLLAPIADLELSGSVVVLRGASSTSGKALDELLEQTRSLLSFSSEMPTETLKTQLAFNAIGGDSAAALELELTSLLPALPTSARILDVGIFHGVGLAVDLRAGAGAGSRELAAAIGQRLEGGSYIDSRPEGVRLGTMDAAGCDGILLAHVEPRPHGAGLWAVFDNLTLAARNAVELAESLPDRWLKVN